MTTDPAAQNQGGAEHFASALEAIPKIFEPKVPCRIMETRACVDLAVDESKKFRKTECPKGHCVRFEKLDRETS